MIIPLLKYTKLTPLYHRHFRMINIIYVMQITKKCFSFIIFYSLHYLITRLLGAQLCGRVLPNPKEYKQVVREEVIHTNVHRALAGSRGTHSSQGREEKYHHSAHEHQDTHTADVPGNKGGDLRNGLQYGFINWTTCHPFSIRKL